MEGSFDPHFRADSLARLGRLEEALADCAFIPEDHWMPGVLGLPRGNKAEFIAEIKRRAVAARRRVRRQRIMRRTAGGSPLIALAKPPFLVTDPGPSAIGPIMKPASSALVTYLTALRAQNDATLLMADCFTFTLQSGLILTYTNIDVPVTLGGTIFAANSVLVDGLKYRASSASTSTSSRSRSRPRRAPASAARRF